MTEESKTNKPNRLLLPNTYQSPNFYIDDLLPLLTGEEWKCMSFLIRKTLGWHKRSDRLAKSVIAKATGLAESTVDKCMNNLVSFGLAIRKDDKAGDHNGVEYEIQMQDDGIKWEALEERKAALAAKNTKRTEAARKAVKIKVYGTPAVAQTPVVPHTPSPVVPHTPSPVVPQPTQNTIKPTTKVGAGAPPADWEATWQLKAGVEKVTLPSEDEALQARIKDAVGMFAPAYQDLVKAFILATDIFPLKKEVANWQGAFKDQIERTGLSTEDVTDACKLMRKDNLTIFTPHSIMNKVPDIRAARKQKQSQKSAQPQSVDTPFSRALDRRLTPGSVNS